MAAIFMLSHQRTMLVVQQSIRNYIDYKVRNELNAHEDDHFESMWVEVNTSATKNMSCGCVYGHPNTDVEKFIKYLDTVFSKAKVERNLSLL